MRGAGDVLIYGMSEPHSFEKSLWEQAEIAAGNLSKALDAIKLGLANDKMVRNHPERRVWEKMLTECAPPLPTMLKTISSVEKLVSKSV